MNLISKLNYFVPNYSLMIKRFHIFILFALILQGCQTDTSKLGYVESDRLLVEFNETKIEGKKIEQNTEQLRMRFDTLRSELESLEKEFKTNLDKYTVKEREVAENNVNRKKSDVDKYYSILMQKIKEEDKKVTTELLKKIDKVVKAYGEKNNYDIIFGANSNGNLVYAKKSKNLTDEIIKELNK